MLCALSNVGQDRGEVLNKAEREAKNNPDRGGTGEKGYRLLTPASPLPGNEARAKELLNFPEYTFSRNCCSAENKLKQRAGTHPLRNQAAHITAPTTSGSCCSPGMPRSRPHRWGPRSPVTCLLYSPANAPVYQRMLTMFLHFIDMRQSGSLAQCHTNNRKQNGEAAMTTFLLLF